MSPVEPIVNRIVAVGVAIAAVLFVFALLVSNYGETMDVQPAVMQQQVPGPYGTVTVQAAVMATMSARLSQCRQQHEAAYLQAWAWYTTTLAMQTACPDAGVPTPSFGSAP